MYEYSFHLTLPNCLPDSLAVVMLFGRSSSSWPLDYNSTLLLPVYESPSSSGYTTRPLDFELVALTCILFVYDKRNLRKRVTFCVRL